MAQFAEAGMGRQAQAIMGQQQGGIQAMLAAQQAAAGGAESRLGRANQAAMGGMNALTASLEASRAAQRGAMHAGGMANTAAVEYRNQGNYLNALSMRATRTALARMQATGNQQSQGLADYMRLQATKDSMRSDRLNEMLGLEDRYRTSQNEVLNQMAQYGQMPINALMQMITGIRRQVRPQARTSPWASDRRAARSGGDRRAAGSLRQLSRAVRSRQSEPITVSSVLIRLANGDDGREALGARARSCSLATSKWAASITGSFSP